MKCLKMPIFLFLLNAAMTYGYGNQEIFKLEASSAVGGYSSLQDSIEYPPILWRAGAEAAFRANARISSTGEVLSVEFKPLLGDSFTRFDFLFFPEVSDNIYSARWRPAKVDEKAISCRVSIPFVFMEISNTKETKKA